MARLSKIISCALFLFLVGCVSMPVGPNVMVLPGTGIAFDKFRNDDTLCELYANSQVGNYSGNGSSTEELQERYDVAYVQCMYAKGHRVPVSGEFSDITANSSPSREANIPPPPEGSPPPPPGVEEPAIPR